MSASRTAVAPRVKLAAGILAVIVALGVISAILILRERSRLYPPIVGSVSAPVETPIFVHRAPAQARTLDPYAGLGAWLDVFDYSPPYGPDGRPNVDPSVVVDEMAAAGVRTIFIQAARIDDRSPEPLENRWVLTEVLLSAHQRDMAVVAWFLPKLEPGNPDNISRLQAMVDFEVLGHRFDGMALDIEAEPEPTDEELADRNTALVTLSSAARWLAGDMPVGAIVLPPPLIEDVNDKFWPEFPWLDIAPFYDVWLPMSYWSGRSDASGYGDGFFYNVESSRLIRERIGQPGALVHGIGGIGGVAGERDFNAPELLASIDDFPLFADSLATTDSIGGSIYDWQTQDADARALMTELFTTGAASALPAPPEWTGPS